MHRHVLPDLVALASVLGTLLACSASQSDGTSDLGGGATGNRSGDGTGAVGGSGAGSGNDGWVGGFGGLVFGDAGDLPPIGNGETEICDGIDNDENGIIDDVDANSDGVCDCLNIGTLGHIGPWGQGNIFEEWLNTRSPRPALVIGDGEITAEVIQGLHVIVSLNVATVAPNNDHRDQVVHAYTEAEASALALWVKGGGGLMTTIGYSNDERNEVTNVNRLLAPLDMAYSSSKLDLQGFVERWGTHAVTDGVSKIRVDNGVEPEERAGVTVAWDSGNRVALRVAEVGEGRVAVWGDEWISYNSEWADVKEQQVELFWLNLLKWLSPPNECQVAIPPHIR
jgi:hypothetical protein